MMRFPYQPEPLAKNAPPTLPKATQVRLRPLIRIRVIAANRHWSGYRQAVADTGSADTLFPARAATWLGALLLPRSSQSTNWRGTQYPLRFAQIELQLSSRAEIYRWPATVGFTSAPIPYPLLGITGFFEFFDATFRGADHILDLTPARTFPGTVTPLPGVTPSP